MGRSVHHPDSGADSDVIFKESPLKGVYLIEPELLQDTRGFFARSWCRQEFRDHGLDSRLSQCSISFNRLKGTVRGMHYQAAPHGEGKLVRCTHGSVYDVVVDLRRDSRTFCRWFGVELSASNHAAVYIPEYCAHGFQALENDTELFYQMTVAHTPEAARGLRWNDPALGIELPLPVSVIAERDATYPDFDPNGGHEF